jgi:glucose-6-phosphate isomerase
MELGKVLARRIIPELAGEQWPEPGHDSSTNALIRRYRWLKREQETPGFACQNSG